MDKKAVFKELLDKFETEEMRLYCEDMIENIPDYIFTMPSSTSGKFHNATQCKKHGQIYHIIMFGAIMNYLLALKHNKEKFSTPKERDAMRCVPIFHDAIKCGWNGSTFTVHDHPMLAGEWVENTNVEHNIDDETKKSIANMCRSHSGEWTTSKRSKIVMPEPQTDAEKLVHECDILSSRADIDMQPSDYLKEVLEEGMAEGLPDPHTFIMDFGKKYSGMLLKDVVYKHHDYIDWMRENNITREPLMTLIEILENEKQEDDEI